MTDIHDEAPRPVGRPPKPLPDSVPPHRAELIRTLRKYMDQADMNGKELAARAYISEAGLSRFLTGNPRWPTWDGFFRPMIDVLRTWHGICDLDFPGDAFWIELLNAARVESGRKPEVVRPRDENEGRSGSETGSGRPAAAEPGRAAGRRASKASAARDTARTMRKTAIGGAGAAAIVGGLLMIPFVVQGIRDGFFRDGFGYVQMLATVGAVLGAPPVRQAVVNGILKILGVFTGSHRGDRSSWTFRHRALQRVLAEKRARKGEDDGTPMS
ncbi:helix-turn-helix domain-containing protein [Streptomyces sp. NPDC088785]|uniref:helix-turn-helix domain-containing protein n=1 Tax=Streptomyces sp. NPDC088785 TaxID=3365897 RepID=UPI0038098E2D